MAGRPSWESRPPARRQPPDLPAPRTDATGLALVILSAAIGIALVLVAAAVFIQAVR
jgi:hypothetical protein